MPGNGNGSREVVSAAAEMCLLAFSYMAVSEKVCVMIFLAELSSVYWNALRNLRTSF